MNIDQTFKAFKKDDLKVGCKLKLDRGVEYSDRRTISKVLKLDENNEYRFAITRPMPTGCIKEKKLLHGQNLIFYLELLIYMIILYTYLL